MSTVKSILASLKWPLTLILTLSSLGAMASLPQPAPQEKDTLVLSLDMHDKEGVTLPQEDDGDEDTKTEQKAFPQLSQEDSVKEDQKDDQEEDAGKGKPDNR